MGSPESGSHDPSDPAFWEGLGSEIGNNWGPGNSHDQSVSKIQGMLASEDDITLAMLDPDGIILKRRTDGTIEEIRGEQ